MILLNSSFTILIIIFTVIVSIMAWQNDKLFRQLIFYPPAITQGQWYRFITHGFIHADSMHLLFNMFTLYFFGRVMEGFYNQFIGGFGFIVFYLFAIIAAILPSYLKNKNNAHYLSLGASGGVSAVLFAFILFYPWESLYLFGIIRIPAIIFAIAYVGYSIYANKKGNSNINHSAHLWGAAFGIITSIGIEPNLLIHFLTALMNPSL